MTIGTLQWAERGGSLSFGERWRVTLGAVRKRATLRSAKRGGPATALDQLDLRALDSIEPPWNALSVSASAAAQELQPQWLTNHGWRSYAWGALLAINADLKYDKSLFFAACQLHDLGLTTHAAYPKSKCFTIRGADAAGEILKRANANPEDIRRVQEAITLHMNLDVGVEHGVEAHLLQAGAGFDVVGQRHNEMPESLVGTVLERHPRLGFKQNFCHCMSAEGHATPKSRAGLYVRRLGFLDLIQATPFVE